ncbi:hypothetical protein J1C56_09510 [Aminobacter anthyllidis]|uniref:Panthothenate synthetase n=1 Tax=Aminobacter anthyllidis TaxID=1035067 RepID=A0A9X1AAB4_9HYPH|nr:hypothetical protein [Aminobacter anthyllidis]MBT1155827.1 hypothetical protein [Aminobacter anthyllidis]
MRMMLKVSIPTEDGNRAIKDGSLPRAIERAMADLKPEAAYFTAEGGRRTAFIFVDVAHSSDMPMVAERFFFGFNANVDMIPVMNAEDLRKGLPAAMAALAG